MCVRSCRSESDALSDLVAVKVTHSARTKNTSSIVAFQTEKYFSTLRGKMTENGTPNMLPNDGGRLGVTTPPNYGFCKSRY